MSEQALARLAPLVERLGDEAAKEVAGQGVARDAVKLHPRAQLRYAGSDTALEVDWRSLRAMRRAFEAAHKARFGFIDRAKALVVEAVNVEAVGGAARFAERARPIPPATAPVAERARRNSSPTAPGARRKCSCARISRSAPTSPARR